MMCYVCYGCLNRWIQPGLYVMFMLCSLWMLQYMNLLLHKDIVKIVKVYVMFAMDASTNGLVAYGHSYNLVVAMCARAKSLVA